MISEFIINQAVYWEPASARAGSWFGREVVRKILHDDDAGQWIIEPATPAEFAAALKRIALVGQIERVSPIRRKWYNRPGILVAIIVALISALMFTILALAMKGGN